jgi:tetratricopeptide (TPR) repeat protein
VKHLNRHKKRLIILKPKIEGLPDDHRSKPECLSELSQLFSLLGNYMESKRLVSRALKLYRERGDDPQVALALQCLSDTNRLMGLTKEGIQQAKEALRIYERLSDRAEQAECLIALGWLLHSDNQLDAAEEAAFRAIYLLPETGEQFRVCGAHRLLGDTYRSKGNTEKAIYYFEVALGIASSFNWHQPLFWAHYRLAVLFRDEGRFDNANDHIESAKSHTIDNAYNLGLAMEGQARVWYRQHRLEEARSEALQAADVYEKLGDANRVEECRKLLKKIKREN